LAVVKHGPTRDPEALLQAARSFFGNCCLDVLGNSTGYSGSTFARVEASTGTWLLRQWPSEFEEGRLRFMHRALLESRSRGFWGVPKLAKTKDGDALVRVAGRLYDAQEWTKGQPLSSQRSGEGPVPNVAVRVPPRRLLALAQAVARFHASTARLHPEGNYEVDPLTGRLRKLIDATEGSLQDLQAGVRHCADGAQRATATRWLDLLPKALLTAHEASLRLPPNEKGARVLCHGDLWPAHTYFQGEDFVGFADFESLAFAPPALDLAQLLAHFGGWEVRERVMRAYGRFAPLAERYRAVLALEVVADLASEGLWSLEALYLGPSSELTGAQRTAHPHNLRTLLGSLEEACEAAEALAGEA
jgi:Ser/Thr protein kinase RdoA (MazF antagonist)